LTIKNTFRTPKSVSLSERFETGFQTRVLAIAVREPYFMSLYGDIIKPSLFDSQYHKDVCLWLREFWSSYGKLPQRSSMRKILKDKIDEDNNLYKGYDTLITQIYKVDISDGDFIKDQVIKAARYQTMKVALSKSIDMLDRGDFSGMKRTIDNAYSEGFGAGDMGLRLRESPKNVLLRYSDEMEQLNINFPHLQHAVGGFYPGEMSLVVAPPNRGKTATMGNMALGAALRGHKVIYYTLEIKDWRLMMRFYANLARVKTAGMIDNIKKVDEALRLFRLRSGGELWVKFFPGRAITHDTIRSHISMSKSQEDIDAAFLDYSDLVRYEGQLTNRQQQLSEMYEDERAMASEFGIHLFTASQSGQETVDKWLYHATDSYDARIVKAATVDNAIVVCQTEDEYTAGVCRLYCDKTRGEKRGTMVFCRTNWDYLRMVEIEVNKYVEIMRNAGFRVNKDGSPRGTRKRKGIVRPDSDLDAHYGGD